MRRARTASARASRAVVSARDGVHVRNCCNDTDEPRDGTARRAMSRASPFVFTFVARANSHKSRERASARCSSASALDAVRVVLVRPEGPTNVGAAARALQNFGVKDFKLVAPSSAVSCDGAIADDAYKYAVHASWMLNASDFVRPDVAAACADRTFVVAATARPRENLPLLTLRECAERIRDEIARGNRVAVLFGNERTGLTNEELAYANVGLRVPTAGDARVDAGTSATTTWRREGKYTGGSGATAAAGESGGLTPVSMNLGMCVGVVAYELFNRLSEDDVGEYKPFVSHALTVEEKKRLIEDLLAARLAIDVLATTDEAMGEESRAAYVEKERRQIARALAGSIPSRDAVTLFFLARRTLALARIASVDDAVLAVASKAVEENPSGGAKSVARAVKAQLDVALTAKELDRVLRSVRQRSLKRDVDE